MSSCPETVIRLATPLDVDSVTSIYDRIHTAEECGRLKTGWIRGVYPVRDTAISSLERGELFVEESDGIAVGCAVINRIQPDVYREADWKYNVPDSKIMVLHTLAIDPYKIRCGLGKAFVSFYEEYAKEHGCESLRLDTNVLNVNARAFYNKLGYTEAGVRPCNFNGIAGINLVMLEKKL
ncbi:MAG: GNAT family N-acetyltransferase [Eubacteriales bacterium]|nr:GNAT family N-acetyltransferase [Eubacteriales bacterium]